MCAHLWLTCPRSIVAQIWPPNFLARTRTELDRIRPMWAESAWSSKFVNFCRTWSRFGHVSAKLGQTLSNWALFGQLGPNSAESYQCRATYVPKRATAKMGHIREPAAPTPTHPPIPSESPGVCSGVSLIGCRLWGGGLVGAEFDRPDLGLKVGARRPALDDIPPFRPADRVGTSSVGSATKIGARKTQHCPDPHAERPSSGAHGSNFGPAAAIAILDNI